MTGITRLSTPALPPSFNRVGYRGDHWRVTGTVRLWKMDLGVLLMVEKMPKACTFIEANAVLTFPVKRRRDSENYRPLLSKALGDILVEAQFLPDDTDEFFRFSTVFLDVGKPSGTVVELRWTK